MHDDETGERGGGEGKELEIDRRTSQRTETAGNVNSASIPSS